jgi:predicted AAA+ superfamily ATPase
VIPRSAQDTVVRLARGFRVVTVTGPRQSGKTTLSRIAFPDKPYVNLEAADERAFAQQDPRGFLARFPDGAIIDEAQSVPELFSYIQPLVDEDQRPGRFVLTGSQNFGLLAKITQSLAGRVGILHLLPLSLGEFRAGGIEIVDIDDCLYRGFYPALSRSDLEPYAWHASYVTTYLERDVRQVTNVQDLRVFQRFLALCAARTGRMLNLASLAADCGIAQSTARAWLSVLEASYVVHLLQPHHENLGKRVVKTPKLYFHDVGLAAFLMGIQDRAQLATHAARGALFETFVIGEFLKSRFNAGLRSNLYFWRDNIGTEVDALVEDGRGLFPIEIKSGRTYQSDFVRSLRLFANYAGKRAFGAGLVYGGDDSYVREGVTVRSWRDL